MSHVFYTNKDFDHNSDEVINSMLYKQVVEGGLQVCKVCGCFEGGLTTDCPKEPVSANAGDLIYKGKLDFISGLGWIDPNILG